MSIFLSVAECFSASSLSFIKDLIGIVLVLIKCVSPETPILRLCCRVERSARVSESDTMLFDEIVILMQLHRKWVGLKYFCASSMGEGSFQRGQP